MEQMREKYESLSAFVLKDLAKARGIKGVSSLKKGQIIERMLEEDAKEVEEAEKNGTAEERANSFKEDYAALDSGEEAEGILEVMPEGFGFIRCDNYMPGDHDIYVAPAQIRRFNLKTGDIIKGNMKVKSEREKFQEKNLTMMVHFTDEPSIIYADGQRMWRVLENVFGNVVKYAMEGTRVYAEISNRNKKVTFSLKNISAQPLNISADELTERFIRGDVARNTEGSGLGLSIAKSLTELQGGEFKLYLDGDLFKVMITFVAKNYSK